jgi:hypothetical protein
MSGARFARVNHIKMIKRQMSDGLPGPGTTIVNSRAEGVRWAIGRLRG